jgi:glycopeptide antibiotics resistance protein
MNQEKIKSFILYGVFAFYVLLLVYITLFKNISFMQIFSSSREYQRVIEIVPFNQIYGYLSGSLNVSPTVVFFNIFGNIAIFIPLGIYIALFIKDKDIFAKMLFIFLVSLSIEIIQFVFGLGASDIDDIILNCLGGFIGLFFYKVLALLVKNDEKVRITITIFTAIVGLPILIISTLLFMHN